MLRTSAQRIDDDRDWEESIAVLLTLTGNETDVAYDGVPALGVTERFRPDVALLDVGLPKLNGGGTLDG
jgi:DNA-binding response OmpR family regulator